MCAGKEKAGFNITATIREQLEKIAEEMCDNYYKYPLQYSEKDWDWMLENNKLPCNDCPLMKLF